MPRTRKKEQNAQAHPGHPVEWVLGALSALLVLGLAAFLVYEGLTGTGGEPALRFGDIRTLERGGTHGLVVQLHNDGPATAAQVEVTARLDGDPLVRHGTLDFAPAHSRRDITFLFDRPVSPAEVELSILSYVDP